MLKWQRLETWLACSRNSRIPTKNKLGILEFLLKLRIKNDKFKTD